LGLYSYTSENVTVLNELSHVSRRLHGDNRSRPWGGATCIDLSA